MSPRSDHSTDSGAASGDHSPHPLRGEEEGVVGSTSPGDAEKVHYKIGDLGHVASIYGGEVSPEEGDCRYMAPEFLEMEVSLIAFLNHATFLGTWKVESTFGLWPAFYALQKLKN